MPEPSRMDLAVHAVVDRALADYEPGVAEVSLDWGERAGTWFTEVTPKQPGAAPLSISFNGDDLLKVNVGPTSFEVFPFTESTLDYLDSIVRAVLAGQVEESGPASRSFARIHTSRGTVGVGHAHFPLPWRRRQVRHYDPYGSLSNRG